MIGRLQNLFLSDRQQKQKWILGPHEAFRAKSRLGIFMSISIFCYHNQPINGYYFEFGCHKARTMRLAWDTFHSLYDWTYVAFDSFEGLPEMDPADSMPLWRKGDLKTSEEDFVRTVVKHGMPREKLKIVKGFYRESLTPAVKAELLPQKAAVIYIDCDLYSSTVSALDFSKDFLQKGTVLVFDDWFCFYGDPNKGERRAFQEFRNRNPDLVFEDYIQSNEAKAFIFLGKNGTMNGAEKPW
ncbi:MAG TPA: TylF/MycF/NovP-related O-methyltransferase [Candidatus Angelobacter sp.]